MIFGSHALHECIIETTHTNTVGLLSTRSLVSSTLVNSHLSIGQYDPWSVRTSIVPQLDPQNFRTFFMYYLSVISRTVTEDELCIFILTVPRRYFCCGSLLFLLSVFILRFSYYVSDIFCKF